MSPWAECPCWTWEAMIPLAKVVQLQACWKQRCGEEGELFRSMSFNLKGKTVALRSQTIFLKHDFCLCCRGIYCSKTSWHLCGVGRTDLHKKREKIETFKGDLKGQYPDSLSVWGILFGQSCCWAFCDQIFVRVMLRVCTAACRR